MAELKLVEAYRTMLTIRRFEERVLALSLAGGIAGSVHLCLGQEAIPVGAVAALRPQDRVLSTYRGHGWALAMGCPPTDVLAEIAQRSGGLNGGRAGSAMLSSPERGFLGENAIVGAGFPIGAGVALAAKSKGEDQVVLSSIGDGAMNQGSVTEGMVLAAARNLPVIFLCENNGWAEMTPISTTTRDPDLVSRSSALGIESYIVDGNNPRAVQEAVAAAIQKCIRDDGPVFLECKTNRLSGHYNRDIQHYRPKEDQERANAADAVARLREELLAGETAESELAALEHKVEMEIDEVERLVVAMPAPDPTTIEEHVYGAQVAIQPASTELPADAADLTYQRAVNAALSRELEERPDLLVYGEDVGFAGGIFGVSRGLQKRFGGERVFDTPIAESAILGSAVGAAIAGMRPVVEIMWADFLFVALDQIVNQAANVRYISRSKMHAPLTIRTQQGATPGSCAQHSQSVEALLAHIPGIKVGLASTPQDAYAMMRASIADDDPTVLIEARSLYQQSGPVDLDGPLQNASGARLHRDGADVAILTWGEMVHRATEAASILGAEGVSAAVLDLRWLRPLDLESISRIVRRVEGRVVVAHEDTVSAGFGAEIAARITELHSAEFPVVVARVGSPEVRIPSAPVLQKSIVPGSEEILAAARRVLS